MRARLCWRTLTATLVASVVTLLSVAGGASAAGLTDALGANSLLSMAATAACDCDGTYVSPDSGEAPNVVELAPDDETYEVQATAAGAPPGLANLTVKRKQDGATVLSGVQGAQWGFSPDSHRFAYHYVSSGVHHFFLYDLSAGPLARKVLEGHVASSESQLGFSPSGRHFLHSYLSGTSTATLAISDAATGEERHETSFRFETAPGSGGSEFGTASWGFSPDDDRFVYHHVSRGVHNLFLYDLTAAPARKVLERAVSTNESEFSFSSSGRYFFYAYLTGATSTSLTVADSTSGAIHYQTSFAFQSPPGSAGRKFGVASWGFGPAEESLVYAYVSGRTSVQWNLVNLVTERLVANEPVLSTAVWQFSPCGDVVGIVKQPNQSQVAVTLRRTRDGGSILSSPATFPLGAVKLKATAASHIAEVNGQNHILAPNTGCDGGGGGGGGGGGTTPNEPPAAGIVAPDGPRALVPVGFTDASTDSDGSIVAWDWQLGDGGSSGDQDPTHTYESAGTYRISLQVTDDRGGTDTVVREVTVAENAPPEADFTYDPPNPRERDVLTFTDASTDDDAIESRRWQIGRTSSSEETVRVKVCDTVQAELEVADGAGQTDTETKTVAVERAASDEIMVPSGSDLSAAIEGACPGDTIRLEAGTYRGNFQLADVNLVGVGAGRTVLEGIPTPAGAFVVTARPSSDSSVTIRDLTVTGGGVATALPHEVFAYDGGGVSAEARDTDFRLPDGLTRLLDVEVKDSHRRGGVRVDSGDGDLEVRGSHIHHNSGGGVGMQCCGRVTVADSEIAFNRGGGAQLNEGEGLSFTDNYVHHNMTDRTGGGLSTDMSGVVARNRFVGNVAGAEQRGNARDLHALGGGVHLKGNARFLGNLVARNGGGGLLYSGHGRHGEIASSTIADNEGPGLVKQGADNCPAVPNRNQEDSDRDRRGDACESDDDADGVPDPSDNCPTTANPEQADGDGNGRGDACQLPADGDHDGDQAPNAVDNCPDVFNDGQEDADGDGQGEACDDDDGDAAVNTGDNCPVQPNPGQRDGDGDGFGDACDSDLDGDSIDNEPDNCRRIHNPQQEDADGDGAGDACDPGDDSEDGDADGVPARTDNCPAFANPDQRDADGDGTGDACDDDDDDDRIDDVEWTLSNTIVTGNSPDVEGGPVLGSRNLLGRDARFLGGDEYHLGATSPAIDAGDDAALPAGLATDSDGDDRILDGDGDGTATVDIGYDEYKPSGTPDPGGGGAGGGGPSGGDGPSGDGGSDGSAHEPPPTDSNPAPGPDTDMTPPLISPVLAERQRINALVSQGLRFRVTSNEPVRITATLEIPRRLAGTLRIARRRPTRRTVTIGRGSASLTEAGTARVTVRLTGTARRRIRRKRNLTATLRLAVTDLAGNATSLQRGVRFRYG